MKLDLKYGTILGVSFCLWTLITFLAGLDTTRIDIGHHGDKLIILLPVITIVLATRKKRELLGKENFRYKQALRTGIVVSAIGFAFYQPFLAIYHHFINPDWLTFVLDFQRQRMIDANVPQEVIDQRVAQIASGSDDFKLAVNGLIFGVFVLGFLISTGSFAFLRNWRKKPSTSDAMK